MHALGRCRHRAFSALATTSPPTLPLVNGVTRHVVAALVANQATTVAEITNLFCARGYNVDSIVVGRTNVPNLIRLSVVVHGTDHNVHMMQQQLHDVVQVAAVKNLTAPNRPHETTLVERDLLLAKVSLEADPDASLLVDRIVAQFNATVVDATRTQVMVQLTADPLSVEAFLQALNPLGVLEVHRSGVVAMDKECPVTAERALNVSFDRHHPGDMDAVDSTMLPPG
ncbi:acetolactate synthase, small subunit [Aphanomyces invadans]|uniref:Acetolactate synthase, small subunit n=1 Tax=Aphanomyces invadans TaxID=157072 RepID=A0A024UKN2_9STRA|nr:acetolactate synthase, small subunit [Aphanomyces invadans]ETW06387.1 acetolactate synthase, small subunit [Aphanomyces invadans]RHY23170.1 hypothetical protein DYB32_009748 [Aphanomyces invadans]|eukprot:XP_008864462.1 acetolactate synthase, small subunit [Aphanomyces invadans]